jgi:hypothetical protein
VIVRDADQVLSHQAADQFGSPASQHKAKQASHQSKLNQCSARCIFVSTTHLANGAASLPILGHAPDRLPVEVRGISDMCSKAIGQGFPGIPVSGGYRRWVSISHLLVPDLPTGLSSPPTPRDLDRAGSRPPASEGDAM